MYEVALCVCVCLCINQSNSHRQPAAQPFRYLARVRLPCVSPEGALFLSIELRMNNNEEFFLHREIWISAFTEGDFNINLASWLYIHWKYIYTYSICVLLLEALTFWDSSWMTPDLLVEWMQISHVNECKHIRSSHYITDVSTDLTHHGYRGLLQMPCSKGKKH